MTTDLENFLASFKFARSTKDNYRRILKQLLLLPNLEHLDPAGLLHFLDKPHWKNAQQNVALFCSKKFLRWRYGDAHPALSTKIPYIKPKPRRVLNPDQAIQILASFDTYKPSGARDLAIIAFALDTGFRRKELCEMQLADVDFYSNTAAALCKGGQWGYGAFSPQTAAILQHWLHFRKPADAVGNLFLSIKTGHALTVDGFECIFKRISKALGFPISPHDLRSSYATLSAIFGASSRAGQIGGRWKTLEEYEHYTATLQLDIIRPHLPMANLTRLDS